ncbi:MAG: ornithine carbamoyltransferase [Planctomycetales bacterium]|nr:ornithine carbamoyltransferase [Planctomycetales bacterium]
MRHFLTLADCTPDEVEQILDISAELKEGYEAGNRPSLLANHVLGLLFSKPSLRTRVSFEAGISHLGGTSLYLGNDVGWGKRETPSDFSRVLSQFLDFVVCRTHDHSDVEILATHADCIVINGLTDKYHPCQAIADALTLRELKGNLKDCKLTYVGDGNNVARSLALVCDRLGMTFTIACPNGYQLDQAFLDSLPNAHLMSQTDDAEQAVSDATAVYTDVWSSMGYEAEEAQRKRDFADFQVNEALMAKAPSDAIFMHCLPAHRGDEVTDGVMDSDQSRVVEQAANRMHAQKGLMVWLARQTS